jgi:hypothetical protein
MLNKIFQHCGLEDSIPKEDFPENFYPVPSDYIVYQTGSEKKSQIYDYSSEVIPMIHNFLQVTGIQVIQVGDKDDPSILSSLDLRGALTIRQLAYVIKNSKLCITSNQFTSKLCRVYNKSLILLGSNYPSKQVVPSFDKVVYIESELKTARLNYKKDEWPKNINSIKPEVIANAILNKIGIEDSVNYKTLYIGEKFGPRFLNFIPEGIFPKELVNTPFNIRLDIIDNQEYLSPILNITQADITTKRPLDLNSLNIKNIRSIVYFCDESFDVNFIKSCISNLINLIVICCNDDLLNELRLETLGICTVYKKSKEKPLDILEKDAMLFKSNRVYIARGKTYASIYHYKNDLDFKSFPIELKESFMNDEDFLENKDYTLIFKNESK